jgi:hypothetical protein
MPLVSRRLVKRVRNTGITIWVARKGFAMGRSNVQKPGTIGPSLPEFRSYEATSIARSMPTASQMGWEKRCSFVVFEVSRQNGQFTCLRVERTSVRIQHRTQRW